MLVLLLAATVATKTRGESFSWVKACLLNKILTVVIRAVPSPRASGKIWQKLHLAWELVALRGANESKIIYSSHAKKLDSGTFWEYLLKSPKSIPITFVWKFLFPRRKRKRCKPQSKCLYTTICPTHLVLMHFSKSDGSSPNTSSGLNTSLVSAIKRTTDRIVNLMVS